MDLINTENKHIKYTKIEEQMYVYKNQIHKNRVNVALQQYGCCLKCLTYVWGNKQR